MSDSHSDWFDELARQVEELAGERREWFDEGLRESTDDFFQDRAPWLAQAGSVRVMTTDEGHYDVVIRVDGAYVDAEEAESIAELLQAKIYGHLSRLEAEPDDDLGE